MLRTLPLLLLALGFLTGCGPRLRPYTQSLQEEQQWQEEDLRRIQFYLSEDVVLQRELRSGNSRIRNGSVQVINGREVEQVVFRRNTPGVFTFSPKEQRIAISFEEDDGNFLLFGPNPKNGGRYSLLASNWDRNSGTVTYAGREWRVSSADAFASLLIPLKRIREEDTRGRVVRGRRL
ncbi:hypothetical protein GGR26_000482 [Lewinella marina]|uniref:Lipoprotein n=1 Tax=Neolewinella marina TaxID=438751 RepID=A0A2G0CJF7_9BACT|nr:hypothetical protein [Neolewinella marina]NJB84737.1 hypothetical protein [Neolewinella marina]PHL00104.1 hypothetical protein CGL56_03420 [Neolewinella marina]